MPANLEPKVPNSLPMFPVSPAIPPVLRIKSAKSCLEASLAPVKPRSLIAPTLLVASSANLSASSSEANLPLEPPKAPLLIASALVPISAFWKPSVISCIV